MPLISVIISYFNNRKFILDALSSVINQTYKNIEVIIIFDDENNEDYEYIKKYIKKDKRISIYKNNIRLGAGESRNKGIKFSKGQYIAFLDSDDLWHKEKLHKQITFMQKNNLKISHTSYRIIDNKNNSIGLRIAKSLNFDLLLKSCDIGLSSVVLKKEVLSDINFPNLITKEDYVLWLKISQKGYQIEPIDEILMSWRKTNNSLSSSTIRKLIDGYLVYRKYLNYNMIRSIYSLFILSINYLNKKYK